jgi:hypothetical protein
VDKRRYRWSSLLGLEESLGQGQGMVARLIATHKTYLDLWMGGAEDTLGRVECRTIQGGLEDVETVEHWL